VFDSDEVAAGRQECDLVAPSGIAATGRLEVPGTVRPARVGDGNGELGVGDGTGRPTGLLRHGSGDLPRGRGVDDAEVKREIELVCSEVVVQEDLADVGVNQAVPVLPRTTCGGIDEGRAGRCG